jgi:hypothetical protein
LIRGKSEIKHATPKKTSHHLRQRPLGMEQLAGDYIDDEYSLAEQQKIIARNLAA